MSAKIVIKMDPVNAILTRLGVGKSGKVQRFVTEMVDRRLVQYMPCRSGALSTGLKRVKNATEIEVRGPYARYQYYGKVMVGPPPKMVTDRPLNYDKTGHPLAGPFWDRRMMAAEGKQLAAEVQRYVRGKGGTG